jgi:hypothetical protein
MRLVARRQRRTYVGRELVVIEPAIKLSKQRHASALRSTMPSDRDNHCFGFTTPQHQKLRSPVTLRVCVSGAEPPEPEHGTIADLH